MQHTHRASFIHGELFWLFHIVVSYLLAPYKKASYVLAIFFLFGISFVI